MTNLHLDVTATFAQAAAAMKTLAASVETVNKRINELDRARASPTIVVNTARADAQVGAFATKMRTTLDSAIRSIADFRLDADSTPAERRIAALRAQLVTLQNQRIGVDIDSAAASSKIRAIESELTALGSRSPNIQVRVDVARAAAELALFRRTLGDTETRGRGLSGVFGLIGSGLGSLIGVVGSGISSFGSFAGASTKVGSSLTSLGSTIGDSGSGLGGVFSKLGASVGSAAASITSLAVAAAPMVAVFAAIGGAVSVLIAGIAQLGGAVLALASGVVPLSSLLGTLPGLIAPIGFAVGALVVAFGDQGLKGALDKTKAAFQPVIEAVRGQLRPALTELLLSVSQLAPVFQRATPAITSALSEVTKGFSNIFRSSSFKADLDRLLRDAGTNIRSFGQIAQSTFRGFIDLMVAAQPAVNSLLQLMGELARKFADAMAEGRKTGSINTLLQQGVQVLRQVIDVVVNLAGLFRDLWDSANRTGAFQATLGALNEGVTRFRDYVSQAGGAWDRLMTKAGPITGQLVNLIGQVGDAFVQIGAKVNLDGLFKGIGDAIPGIRDSIISMGNAFSDFSAATGSTFGDIARDIGTTLAGAIDATIPVVTTFKGVWDDLRPTLEALSPVFSFIGKSILTVVEVVTSALDGIVTIGKVVADAIHGDFAGAGRAWDQFSERTNSLSTRLDTLWGVTRTAAGGVTELGAAISGVPQPPLLQFNADASVALARTNDVTSAVQGVQQPSLLRFNADASVALARANDVNSAVSSVRQPPLLSFNADASVALARASDVNTATNSIQQPPLLNFSADASVALARANDVTNAVSAVPQSHDTTINARDNASPVLKYVIGLLSAVHDVTSTITTVYRTITGGADGYVLSPLSGGAVLPMASGGGLTRMSGQSAQIVPPNTWRVIGDRMSGDEAFIPITNSARSAAILAETANRMGYALMPLRHGGYLGKGDRRDERAWEWLREWLDRYRGSRGDDGGTPDSGGLVSPAVTGVIRDMARSAAFRAGTARITSAAHAVSRAITYPTITAPLTPRTATTGGQTPIVQLHLGASGGSVEQLLLEVLRRSIRVQGGNVQIVLGN